METLNSKLETNQKKLAEQKEQVYESQTNNEAVASQLARSGNIAAAVRQAGGTQRTQGQAKSQRELALVERSQLLQLQQQAQDLISQGKTEAALSLLRQSNIPVSKNPTNEVTAYKQAARALRQGDQETAMFFLELGEAAEKSNQAIDPGSYHASNQNDLKAGVMKPKQYQLERSKEKIALDAIKDASNNPERLAQIKQDYQTAIDKIDQALVSTKGYRQMADLLQELQEQGFVSQTDLTLYQSDWKHNRLTRQESSQALRQTTNPESLTKLEREDQKLTTVITEANTGFANGLEQSASRLAQEAGLKYQDLNQEDKALYHQTAELLRTGHQTQAKTMLRALTTGETAKAQQVFEEHMQSLSPEQRLASAQTFHTQRIKDNARSIEQAHKQIQGARSDQSRNQYYQPAKDLLQSSLDTRAELVLIQQEAQRFMESGDRQSATALLNGDLSLDQLDENKLKANNPDAAKITGPNGEALSDQQVVEQERTALQETINQNRMAIAQLAVRTQELDQEIQKREEQYISRPATAMEQRTLLATEQERLERETQRL
ncbi:MAG: hypothetical protein O2962_02870, partial [Cyanobacteria bacterium]|nr:hypothetical protein [Cyanobacteriota bacterium]